jgi:hypothetical protein
MKNACFASLILLMCDSGAECPEMAEISRFDDQIPRQKNLLAIQH